MIVSELIAFLATQPPDALVMVASSRQTFGDTDVQAREAATFAEPPWPGSSSRMVIHPEDIVNDQTVPAVVIGRDDR